MELKGKITKINSDLGYGFVTVKKLGDIFFSEDTSFENASFDELEVGKFVNITAIETPRGLFAAKFELSMQGSPSTEINI